MRQNNKINKLFYLLLCVNNSSIIITYHIYCRYSFICRYCGFYQMVGKKSADQRKERHWKRERWTEDDVVTRQYYGGNHKNNKVSYQNDLT